MSIRALAAISVLVPALAVPAVASAESNALPDPITWDIKVPLSIGGVSLGQSLGNANKAWGGDAECGKAVCDYGQVKGDRGSATIESDDGVTFVGIFGDRSKGKPAYKGPLRKFRTSEGIGLGSKIKKVEEFYPQAKNIDGGYEIEGVGKSYMYFGEAGGLVDTIVLSDG